MSTSVSPSLTSTERAAPSTAPSSASARAVGTNAVASASSSALAAATFTSALVLAALLAAACALPPGRASVPTAGSAGPFADELPAGSTSVYAIPEAPSCSRIARLIVFKSKRTLVAECEGGATRSFPIALGRFEGPKESSGDGRTPEGTYHIMLPGRTSRFHRFIDFDYPSIADARRARGRGLLTRSEFDAIVAAHRAGEMPPQDTPLGGGLGLHGEGERWAEASEWMDWTFGCIALADDAIDFVERRIVDRAEIVIVE